MKIKYRYGQEFELKEIDMHNNKLVFETNDCYGNFERTIFIEQTTTFEISFSSIYELQNIPKMLDDYLKANDLLG